MMRSDAFDKFPECAIGYAARQCRPHAGAGNAKTAKTNHEQSPRPHGMAICRRSIARCAIPCGRWRGGIGTWPIDAIRGSGGSGNRAEAEREACCSANKSATTHFTLASNATKFILVMSRLGERTVLRE